MLIEHAHPARSRPASGLGTLAAASWLAAGTLWVVAIYCLLLPRVIPRGIIWERYTIADLAVGAPALALAVAATAVLVVPPRRRRSFAIALAGSYLLIPATALMLDVGYVVMVGGWRGDYWLDGAHISRAFSKPDPELGFVRKSGITWRGETMGREVSYRTDEHGFRNPPGIRRAEVVFIGDSYTEAGHIPEGLIFPGRVCGARAGSDRKPRRGRLRAAAGSHRSPPVRPRLSAALHRLANL
jgi:hypothetical protein